MKSKIAIFIAFEIKNLENISPDCTDHFSRAILICKHDSDKETYQAQAEKLFNGKIFVSTVEFNIDFSQVVANIYSRIGMNDPNPHFVIEVFGDSFEELKLAEYLAAELENIELCKLPVDGEIL